jgi:biotin carboxyl carrier protein
LFALTFVAVLAVIATLVLVVRSASGSPASQVATPPAVLSSVSAAPRSAASSPATASPAAAEPTRSPFEFIWPADGNVSQGMTPKHPSGVDVGVPTGSEVRAVRDGVVFFVGGDPCCSYGNFIVIGHGEGWSSVYGHLSKFLAKAGDQVKQGQVIALSGETGYVDGPHVHFELRSQGRAVNPLAYLRPARSAPPYVPDTPVPSPTPAPPPGPDLQPGEAIVLAAGWMSQNNAYAYTIDAATCYAMERDVNWLVTCEGSLQGCAGSGCAAYLSACVLEQPRLIARFCP